MTKTKPDWRIDDRIVQLSIADKLIEYLEDVGECGSGYCCDVNLRTAIQLALTDPPDPRQLKRLQRVLCVPTRMLLKVEREHRPKAAAAIDEFREFYKNWANINEVSKP